MPAFLILPWLFLACRGDDSPGGGPAASPTSSTIGEPSAGSSRTGIRLLDDIVAAVGAKDGDRLAELLEYWGRACSPAQGIGALPCPAGAAAGTLVSVVGAGDCEGQFLPKGDPQVTATARSFVEKAGKYAFALEAPAFPTDQGVPGKYALVFEPGMALSVGDEGVTYLIFGCGTKTSTELVNSGRFGERPKYIGNGP